MTLSLFPWVLTSNLSSLPGGRGVPPTYRGTWNGLDNHYLILWLCKVVTILRMEVRKGCATLLKVTALGNGMVMIQPQTWCSSDYTGAELVVSQAGSPLSLWFWLVWRCWRKVCIKMLCDFGTRAVEAYGPLERLAIWARNSRMRFNWKNANEYIWRPTSGNTHS